MTSKKDRQEPLPLDCWRGIEPRPGFEQRVWCRIHAVQPSLWARWTEGVREGMALEPARLAVASLAVGAIIGLGVAWVIASEMRMSPVTATASTEFNLFRSESVTGSYMHGIQNGS